MIKRHLKRQWEGVLNCLLFPSKSHYKPRTPSTRYTPRRRLLNRKMTNGALREKKSLPKWKRVTLKQKLNWFPFGANERNSPCFRVTYFMVVYSQPDCPLGYPLCRSQSPRSPEVTAVWNNWRELWRRISIIGHFKMVIELPKSF